MPSSIAKTLDITELRQYINECQWRFSAMSDIIKLYRNTLKELKKQRSKVDRTISSLEKALGELEQLEMTSTAKKRRKE